MKYNVIASLLVLSLSFAAEAYGASAAERGDSAYNAKNYVEAVRCYEEAVEAEGSSAGLLYNLGNARFLSGDYGQAMVQWQRAHRLNPSDKRINKNIEYLRSKSEDANKAEQKGKRLKLSPDKPSFFGELHSAVAEDVSSNTWAFWGVLSFLLTVACCGIYMFSGNVMIRKTGFFSGLFLFAVSIVTICFSFMAASASTRSDQAVVTAFKVVLLTEPGNNQTEKKGPVLTKGTEVDVVSEETDADGRTTWVKIRVNSDYIGWVEAGDVEVI